MDTQMIELRRDLQKALEEIREIAPIIRSMGKVLVRLNVAAGSVGVTSSSITKSRHIDKYEQVGHKRVFVQIGSLDVLKKYREPRKPFWQRPR